MIPEYDVDIAVEHVTDLQVLSMDEAEDGWLINRLYSWIGVTPWDEVADGLVVERAHVARADATSSSVEEFEACLATDEDDGTPYFGLDVGIGSLTLALNSAGFITGWSCRGHPERHRGDHPNVVFAADRAHLDLLTPLAAKSGCGIGPYNGSVMVWARTVIPMLDVAELILSDQTAFDSLPMMRLADDPDDERRPEVLE